MTFRELHLARNGAPAPRISPRNAKNQTWNRGFASTSLVLKPGSRYITLNFSASDVGKRQADVIKDMLQAAGIRIEDTSVQLGSTGGLVAFKIGGIKSDVVLHFERDNLESFRVESASWKKLADWDSSYGGKAMSVDN